MSFVWKRHSEILPRYRVFFKRFDFDAEDAVRLEPDDYGWFTARHCDGVDEVAVAMAFVIFIRSERCLYLDLFTVDPGERNGANVEELVISLHRTCDGSAQEFDYIMHESFSELYYSCNESIVEDVVEWKERVNDEAGRLRDMFRITSLSGRSE